MLCSTNGHVDKPGCGWYVHQHSHEFTGAAHSVHASENGTGTSSAPVTNGSMLDILYMGCIVHNGSSSVTLSGYNSVVVPNAATASNAF